MSQWTLWHSESSAVSCSDCLLFFPFLSFSYGQYIGIGGGAVLLLVICILVVSFVCYYRSRSHYKKLGTNEQVYVGDSRFSKYVWELTVFWFWTVGSNNLFVSLLIWTSSGKLSQMQCCKTIWKKISLWSPLRTNFKSNVKVWEEKFYSCFFVALISFLHPCHTSFRGSSSYCAISLARINHHTGKNSARNWLVLLFWSFSPYGPCDGVCVCERERERERERENDRGFSKALVKVCHGLRRTIESLTLCFCTPASPEYSGEVWASPSWGARSALLLWSLCGRRRRSVSSEWERERERERKFYVYACHYLTLLQATENANLHSLSNIIIEGSN